ncbi:acetyl/propionyl/methylcrotonyl-CoA carboxylase subunit alpha [Nocardioides sp. CFH 31398]|uniref:acetyl-CoA carboxylase biotin carboxylase subunit n=1 Tax=Nocardioides sp. CFH 31398 TaxID=2919579 RepID=UPI001F062ED7|nr:biotin carboxylase N-terminal domain-containing protein [Nocardioides sp. CFH 31398]MCH1865500.1 ATP-grasp domain-containing protein [Nocardioides sp. CFH 31398]
MTRVLVANRGEIAVRIVAACRRLGFEAVLAASSADADSLAARLADRVLVIGPPQPSLSYLRPELLVQAAVMAGADVLHPGYGFCSEKVELGEMLDEAGIALAGPRPDTLRSVGDKNTARAVAVAAGVPVAAGAEVKDLDGAVHAAREIGYPVLLKAVHGGGGRGIHLVEHEDQLPTLVDQAAAEARAGFGDGALYLEKFFAAARHVEVQVFGDGEGGCVVAGDRDCSVQRRHQKLVEECPAPGIGPATRALLHDSARRLVSHLRYRGAGTVEFLVDTTSDPASATEPATVVFLEVNARIQVEHPVTEEAFGIDLVAAQLRLAAGLHHGLPDLPAVPPAHVIECRITSEDPAADFRPTPGRITAVEWPRGPGVRIDTHVHEGYLFPPYYDSLLAKVIVRAHDREAAVDGMLAALRATRVEGVSTVTPVHEAVLSHPDFRAGGVTTQWLPAAWPPPLEEAPR